VLAFVAASRVEGSLDPGARSSLSESVLLAASLSDLFHRVKGGTMRIRTKALLALGALLTLSAVVVVIATFASAASVSAQHVRWDIISTTGIPPAPINAGGHASATAPDLDMITLTGSGHFVAPGNGGGSSAASGGGTWTTTSGGSGTYTVRALVSWQLANIQANVGFIDNIDEGTRVNGTAVLKIAFSDGSAGVLTVGCHGPGAPPGIFEGIATTKGFKTYYAVQSPSPGVDANRTLFHVR
jgi:hypothetical protein